MQSILAPHLCQHETARAHRLWEDFMDEYQRQDNKGATTLWTCGSGRNENSRKTFYTLPLHRAKFSRCLDPHASTQRENVRAEFYCSAVRPSVSPR